MFDLNNDNIILDLDYSSLYKLINSTSRSVYLALQFQDWKTYKFYSEILKDLQFYINNVAIGLDFTFEDIVKDIHKDTMRSVRLRKRIEKIIKEEHYQYFLTYTFTDEELLLPSDTRKIYVKRFVKALAEHISYVGNIDYGKTTGREHYHFVIGSDTKLDFSTIPSKVDIVLITYGNQYILKNYIDKLAQHGEKVHQRYIYSRG